MRRGGFTMIELIFVIVILGILAAVALPKFLQVGQQAHEGNLKAFVGTLNRTVGPTLWSKAIANDGTGKIANLNLTDAEKNLSAYTNIPKELKASTIDISGCGTNSFAEVAQSDPDVTGGVTYKIECRDGNSSNAPAFRLLDGSGNVIAGSES